jgi:hypothetical protein
MDRKDVLVALGRTVHLTAASVLLAMMLWRSVASRPVNAGFNSLMWASAFILPAGGFTLLMVVYPPKQ